MNAPTMVLIAGPNGSGKSTLYQARIAGRFGGPFINADIIQRDELGDADERAAYAAADIAAERREQHIASGTSFVAETVFSHPSKLDLILRARAAGFLTLVLHVGVEDPEISVVRVAARVQEGGHPVPEDKVRDRYHRSLPLIRRAVMLADVGQVFDNSRLAAPARRCLEFRRGRLFLRKDNLPAWIQAGYIDAAD